MTFRPSFLQRLIRQESNFDPNSVSRAGAQGIAQFMPGTARWRGLSDPFEPTEALYESARWLGERRDQFGNLGLAAAAYNAGPRRLRDWIAGRGQLLRETRAYVRIITGRAAEEWVGVPEEIQHDRPAGPCTEATKSPTKGESHIGVEENANWGPWGLQLISDSSEQKALAEYKQLQNGINPSLVIAHHWFSRDSWGPWPIDMVLCASCRIFPTTSQPTLLAVGICRRKLPRFSQLEPLVTVSHYRLLAAMT